MQIFCMQLGNGGRGPLGFAEYDVVGTRSELEMAPSRLFFGLELAQRTHRDFPFLFFSFFLFANAL